MDLAKFIDLLQSERLFFATASHLGDPLEGSVPLRMSKEYIDQLIQKHGIENLQIWPDVANATALKIAGVMAEQRQMLCGHTYVSCWHMNEHESAAMWRVYSQSAESVCVQTRYSKLAAALPDNIYLGAVRYIDYESDFFEPGNAFNPFVHKRMSFQHESEIRAVFQNHPAVPAEHTYFKDDLCPGGARIKVGIDDVIEAAFVNPASPSWFKNVVANIVAKYGAKFPVLQSKLNTAPLY